MTPPGAVLLLCLQWFLLQEANCFSQATGRRIWTRLNSLVGVNSSCNVDTLSVEVQLEEPFSGVLYSRGFPLECRGQGSGDTWATLTLPATGCGVRVITNEEGVTAYSVVLQIQLDRYLQQATDREHTVLCQLPQPPHDIHLRPAARTGRKQSLMPGREQHNSQKPARVDGDGHARAWLEISGSRRQSYVSVGEQTSLRIKALLPAGSSFRVVDCVAHDGAGDSSQRLLDDEGCPVDESLLPALSLSSSFQRLHVAQAVFPAFKFPDRDNLHLRCEVQVCRGSCPQAQCEDWTTLSPLTLQAGEVLERLEVFNSVQVLAPGIETYDMRSMDSLEDAETLPRHEPDRSVCLSPPKMVLVLSVLVLVFISGVAMVLWTLVQGRRPPGRRWFHSQDSLLVMDSPQLAHRTHWRVMR